MEDGKREVGKEKEKGEIFEAKVTFLLHVPSPACSSQHVPLAQPWALGSVNSYALAPPDTFPVRLGHCSILPSLESPQILTECSTHNCSRSWYHYPLFR